MREDCRRFVSCKLAINFFAVVALARMKSKPRNKSAEEGNWRECEKKNQELMGIY